MIKKLGIVSAGECAPARRHDMPAGSPAAVTMDGSIMENCMFTQSNFLTKSETLPSGLVRHRSDELMMFIGTDVDNSSDLGAELLFRIENDVLHLTETCFVFIPAGKAHGLLEIRDLRRPVLCNTCFYDEAFYEDAPAAPTEPAGRYAGNSVVRYAPVSGFLPPAPEGFLERILWIDGDKLKGAPYMEAVWFKTVNPSGPPSHTHEFDEVIGFLGADPEHPDDLGGTIDIVVGGETFTCSKSFYTFVPRGAEHSPIIVPRLERPFIHFSGGGKGQYIRT